MVNAKLSEATAPHGLYYAPDPSSQSACTLGGNVAENAGGPHCLKYGVTTNHVVALEVVLPSGELVRLGSAQGEPWGPDLVGVFVGSEGMFGVALEITVRLEPLPTDVRTLLAGFDTVRERHRGGVRDHRFRGGACGARDDGRSLRARGRSVDLRRGLSDRRRRRCSSWSSTAAPKRWPPKRRWWRPCCERHGATEVRSAATAEERARLWQGRKKAFGAMGRLTRDVIVQDAVVPRSALPDVLDRIMAIARDHQVTVVNVFHAGDGNLHPNICYDRGDAALVERVRHVSRAIMEVCVAAGGSITGEHGVGSDKVEYMPLLFDETTLGAMCDVRRVFDPEGRANPGKVIPVHSCREWRAGGIA